MNPLFRKLSITALFALCTLIPTAKFVFTNSVPAPVDQIHTLPPWGRPAENDKPWDVLYADAALQFLPWRDLILESMRQGEVPLWNPYTLGGIPLLANSQSAPLYPLHWLWALSGFSAGRLLAFSAWLHLFIAAIGTYRLCRSLRCSRIGAFFAGSAFSLSAFMVSWIPLPSVMMTASWIPWCLYAVHRIFRKRRGTDIALLSISVGLMLLAGHLQVAVYGLMAMFLFALWLWIVRGMEESVQKRFIVQTLIAFLIGFLVASPQLLPVLENGGMGHRLSPPTEEGYRSYLSQSLGLHHLAVFFAPNLFGVPGEWFESVEGLRFPGYWLALREPGRHYAELAFYVGPSILFFSLMACFRNWRKPEVSFFGILFVIAIAAAMGTIITRVMYFWIPGWSATGSPGRVAVLCVLSLSVLAGCNFRETSESPFSRSIGSRHGAFFSGIVILFLTICVALWGSTPREEMISAAYVKSIPYFEILGIATLLFTVFYFLPGSKRFENVIATMAIVLNILVVSYAHKSLLPISPEGSLKESFEGMEFLQSIQPNRIAVINENWTLFGAGEGIVAIPNSLLPYRIHQLDGYDSIIPRRRKELLDSINGKDSAPPANGNMLFLKAGFEAELLMKAGVTHVVSALPLPYPVEVRGNGWALYRITETVPFPEILEERMNTKLVRIPPDRLWAPLEASMPGWWAKSGKQWEALTARSALSGKVELLYLPTSYRVGIFLGMLGIFVIVALSYKR